MCSAWSFSKCVCSGFSHTFSFSNFQTIWEVDAVVRWRVLKQQPSTQDSKRDTDIKNRLLDSVGEGECGMIWESSIETCILPHVKEMTSTSLMHEAGQWKPVLLNNRGIGCGGRCERGSGWGHTCTRAGSCRCMANPPQYCKVIWLQLK